MKDDLFESNSVFNVHRLIPVGFQSVTPLKSTLVSPLKCTLLRRRKVVSEVGACPIWTSMR